MQRQGNIVDSFPESLEFDRGSASNNSIVDRQSYLNNMLLNTADAQNTSDYLLAENEPGSSSTNAANQPGSSVIWRADGQSFVNPSVSHESHGIAKTEQAWPPSSIDVVDEGEPRLEERPFEASGSLSLENINISLDRNRDVNSQIFLQNSTPNDTLQIGMTSQAELGLNNHLPSSSDDSIPHGNPSGFTSEDPDMRSGVSFDGRRLSCKRKNIEGIHGQSSTSRSSINVYPTDSISFGSDSSTSVFVTPAMSENAVRLNSSEEQLPQRFGLASSTRDTESSHRNFRFRVNPAQQHDTFLMPSPWAPHIPIQPSNHWNPDFLSFQGLPLHQTSDSRSLFPGANSQNQPPPRMVSPVPLIVQPSPSVVERMATSRDEANPRNLTRNRFLDAPPYLIPSANVGNSSHEPESWSLASGNTRVPVNNIASLRAGPSSGALSPPRPSWAPNRDASARRLSELVRRSLFPSGASSDSGALFGNIPSQSPVGTGHRPQIGSRGGNQALLRSAYLLERLNDGDVGGSLPIRSAAHGRDGRARMIAEIRNAFDLMRRTENLRFEDVFFLNPAVFYPGADLHDRHRDMRLDVDNMSYEELLALEERIGNVSTGLDESTIVKSLQRWHYQSTSLAVAPPETEPCSICQEEYLEGEEMGSLDCHHDFHSACIKQWLLVKNLCPICKETGLTSSLT